MPSLTGVWRLLSGSSSAAPAAAARPTHSARPTHPEHTARLGILTLGAIGGDIIGPAATWRGRVSLFRQMVLGGC